MKIFHFPEILIFKMWKRSGSKMRVQFTTIYHLINVKLKPHPVFNFYDLLFETLFKIEIYLQTKQKKLSAKIYPLGLESFAKIRKYQSMQKSNSSLHCWNRQ